MSNAVVTFPSSARKPFRGITAAGVIAAVLPEAIFSDTDTVRPSSIHLNDATVVASLGGKITPLSFATAAAYSLARAANGALLYKSATSPKTSLTAVGGSKEGGILAGANEAARVAIVTAAHGMSTHGGITAKALRDLVKAAFAALLALPEKKPAPATVDVPTVVETIDTIDTIEAPVPTTVEPIHAECGGMDNPVTDAWLAASMAYDARIADRAEQARIKAQAHDAEQSRINNGFITLNAEIDSLRALVQAMVQAPSIKAVRALAQQAGFQMVA